MTQDVSGQAKAGKSLDFINIAFLTATPLLAVLGTAWYSYRNGVTWLELALFLVMYLLTGLSITGGYHRYYAHRSYECGKFLQLFYLIFGAAAVENSVLNWSSDHRYHHRFVDQEEDPYNVLRGGLYAHMGWIFYKDNRTLHQKYKIAPDLLKDPLVRWQDRWYLFLVVTASFGLPTLIGLLDGRPLGGLLWGGFLRVVVVQHMTFLINSAAHLWGKRPYSWDNTARDNWWLGPFTFGEGYHNFHHKFPADWRNGIHWYQFDLTKWWLWAMRGAGLAFRLRRTPEPLILRAKLEIQMLSAQNKLSAAGASHGILEKAGYVLDSARTRLESAMRQYHQARVDYTRRKGEWSAAMSRELSRNLENCQAELEQARRSWARVMRTVNRLSYSPSARGFLTLTAMLDIFKSKF